MKLYICKKCGKRGIRPAIRKHLREEHFVRGLMKDVSGKRQPSQLTANTITEEL